MTERSTRSMSLSGGENVFYRQNGVAALPRLSALLTEYG